MLKLKAAAALMILGVQLSAQASVPNFVCFNNMYRQARLEVRNDSRILIQDSAMAARPEVEDYFEGQLNLVDTLHLYNLSLEMPSKDVECEQFAPYLVFCKGQSQKAHLRATGFLQKGPVAGRISLSSLVEVKSFELKTSLRGDGGVLGPEPTTITLNTMEAAVQAVVILNGKEVKLSWSPFFYTAPEGRNSACNIIK